MSSNRYWRLATITGLGLTGGFFLLHQWSTPSPGKQHEQPLPAAFVRSLEGTQPDGRLHFFANLPTRASVTSADLPNLALRRMFDYYLSALGEADESAVLRQIGLEIDKNMSGAYATAARALLSKYVAYKKSLAELEKHLAETDQADPAGVGKLRTRFEAMRQLREKYFDWHEQDQMFGFDDAYDGVALSQLEINLNTALTPTQKEEQLQALKGSMPAQVKAELDAPRQVAQMQNKVDTLRAQGASDDEVYRLRAQTFSPEAAARLAEVDRQEAAWQQRIAQFQAERQRIRQTIESPTEQQAALQALVRQQFSDQERPRLVAYEGP
jgi:lipase chaperone LimK